LKAFQPASLGWDVSDSEAELLVALAWHEIYWNSGATSAMATVVFSIVSISEACR
jgi:hypothetical protein